MFNSFSAETKYNTYKERHAFTENQTDKKQE